MDHKDIEILACLRENSALSSRQVSNATKIPLTTVHNRIARLRKNGVIKRFTIETDPAKMGMGICAYILITALSNFDGRKVSQQKICKSLLAFEGIETADIITGNYDIIVKARFRDIPHLNRALLTKIREIPGVDKTISMIAIEESGR